MRCAGRAQSRQARGGEVAAAEGREHRAVGGRVEQGEVVAESRDDDRHAEVQPLGRQHARRAHRPRAQRQATLDDAADRPAARRAERARARGVDLAHSARGVDLAAEDDDAAEPRGLAGAGDRDGVEQVGGPVGARGAGRADGAREHDRRLAVVQEVT